MAKRQLRYYGAGDYATYWQIDDAASILRSFNESSPLVDATAAIEVYNAQQFQAAGFIPATATAAERSELSEKSARARSAVAKFFTQINATNLRDRVRGIPRVYHQDALALLGSNRAFDRCGAEVMVAVLADNGFHLSEMLSNKKLVRTYDSTLRDLFLKDTRNAELLIRQLFSKERRKQYYLPESLTSTDSRDLMTRYIRSEFANSNYLRLIETAPISEKTTGVTARLKLEAKRRRDRETKEIFKRNPGIKSGAEIRIVDDQEEPVVSSIEDMIVTCSYSREWLEKTTDNPSILNNFQHLFNFADDNVLLSSPAHPAELGVFERFLMTTGQTDYHVGAAYRVREMLSTLQTQLALRFLESHDIELESVVSWFFHDYLPAEFDARGFSFRASAKGSTFLEKTRHLLVEMEGVVRQFTLYAEDGEIDRELLAITSDNVRYHQIPSLIESKYLYPSDAPEIHSVLDALFSDQSAMNYINEDLRADNLVSLLLRNDVSYDQFEEHQTPMMDQLINLGVLRDNGKRIQIANGPQFLILRSLVTNEAASYVHLTTRGRAAADEMIHRGWLLLTNGLLTRAEASYFNFQLNKAEFHNGPEIRNKYLHGSQADADGPDAHFEAYVNTLKLMIALVIKINDDFAAAAVFARDDGT